MKKHHRELHPQAKRHRRPAVLAASLLTVLALPAGMAPAAAENPAAPGEGSTINGGFANGLTGWKVTGKPASHNDRRRPPEMPTSASASTPTAP